MYSTSIADSAARRMLEQARLTHRDGQHYPRNIDTQSILFERPGAAARGAALCPDLSTAQCINIVKVDPGSTNQRVFRPYSQDADPRRRAAQPASVIPDRAGDDKFSRETQPRALPARRTVEYEELPARVSKYAVLTVRGAQYSARASSSGSAYPRSPVKR